MLPPIPKLPPIRLAPRTADTTAQLGLLGLNPAIPEGVRALAEKSVVADSSGL